MPVTPRLLWLSRRSPGASRPPTARAWILAWALAAVPMVTLAACSPDGSESRPAAPGPPGTLIEATRMDAANGQTAWRVVYHSRSVSDADIAVTGLVVVPSHHPASGVVAWGHSTTGTADDCAPSLRGPAEVPMVDEAIAEGWAVVASDFEGLGSEGPHPYLVGVSAGRTMLDAVRAAAQIDGSDLSLGSPVALWGFSQGGQAALFAAEEAPTYAPELDVRGVAAVAAVGDPRQFWERAAARPDQVGVAATMAYGLTAAHPDLDLDDVLTDDAIERLDLMESSCIGEVVDAYTGPVDDVLRQPIDDLPDWVAALEANTAGQRPSGVPALVIQGGADDIVYPEVGDALAQRLCQHGDPVEYRFEPDAGHGDIAPATVVPWLIDRFAGQPARSTC